MEGMVVIIYACTAGRGYSYEMGRHSRIGALEVTPYKT